MGFKINVRVIPNSWKDEVCGFLDNAIKIKLKAKPVDGKANVHLIKFLSKRLAIHQADIVILSGISSRNKILGIYNIEKSELFEQLGLGQDEP